jgi:hypothetical protein
MTLHVDLTVLCSYHAEYSVFLSNVTSVRQTKVKVETIFPAKQQSEYGCISYTCVDINFADVHIVSDITADALTGAVILSSRR